MDPNKTSSRFGTFKDGRGRVRQCMVIKEQPDGMLEIRHCWNGQCFTGFIPKHEFTPDKSK